MSNCSTFSKVALLACTLVYFCNMDNPKSHPIIVLGAVYLRIYDTSELVYPLSILSYSAWNKAMQLTQPKETNRASEAPTTVMMSRVIRAGRAGLSYLLYTLDWFGTSIHGTPIRHTSPRLIVVHKLTSPNEGASQPYLTSRGTGQIFALAMASLNHQMPCSLIQSTGCLMYPFDILDATNAGLRRHV